MDAIAAEAVAHLTTAMTSLLPPPAEPALTPSVLVTPRHIAPTGLGGFTGMHPDPQGEVLGRRVKALVTVNVAAHDAAGMDAAVSQVTTAVLSASRAELAGLGILRLDLEELGPRPVVPSQGPPVTPRRDVAFNVLFEFLKVPAEAGGVIETIPLDIDATLSANDPRVLLRGTFLPDALDLFEVVDDPAATTQAPSAWSFDAGEEAIRQTREIRGGTDAASPDKPGTMLLLRTSPIRPAVRDFSVAAEMRSTSVGGIGFVFRYTDVDNFYFALLDSRTGFRLLGRKVGGVFAALDEGGLDDGQGFATDTLMRVRLVAQGDAFRLLLDGATVLEGRDGDLTAAGRVGFLTRHCGGARFHDLTLVRL